MSTSSPQRYVTTVPIYKRELSLSEARSLLQLRLLGVENVTLVSPENLDLTEYLTLWPELCVQRYAPEHFVSVQSYNDLVISPAFYAPFADLYDYLLIAQLDTFLLSNHIDEFCNLGYDYYGARGSRASRNIDFYAIAGLFRSIPSAFTWEMVAFLYAISPKPWIYWPAKRVTSVKTSLWKMLFLAIGAQLTLLLRLAHP